MSRPIGVVDWGIGGLGVYKELGPGSYVYLSDSGFTPYGKTPKKVLIRRLNQVADFFRQKGITTIVVACNAASTVLDDVKKQNRDLRFFGMLKAGKELIRKSRKKRVLVLGGQRTIRCGFFQNEFKNSKVDLQALVAQPLSALIEQGQHHSKKFNAEVVRLKNQTENAPDAVLLACTHYPAATSVFQRHFPEAVILDPAASIVRKVKPRRQKKSSTLFFTTGSPRQSQKAALKAFDLKIDSFQKITL